MKNIKTRLKLKQNSCENWEIFLWRKLYFYWFYHLLIKYLGDKFPFERKIKLKTWSVKNLVLNILKRKRKSRF